MGCKDEDTISGFTAYFFGFKYAWWNVISMTQIKNG